tara:strand:- start:92 stop:304 length:213 start_codon:yes stop_codon:yes gene_type:complete
MLALSQIATTLQFQPGSAAGSQVAAVAMPMPMAEAEAEEVEVEERERERVCVRLRARLSSRSSRWVAFTT